MNRTIKFRAWDKENNKMIDPETYYLEFYGSGEVFLKNVARITSDIELMQYTGLKDKNGKEIYEGDIVAEKWLQKSEDKDGEHFKERVTNERVVKYDESGFSPFAFATFGDEGISSDKVEIIGNIYENPTLLTN